MKQKNGKGKLVSILLFLSLLTSQMQAQILTVTDRVTPGSWICFRGEIDIDTKKVHDNTLRLAADTKYWLWVNGELQVFEGGLKRGPTPQDTYCDVIQSLKGLRQGKNVIAVLVWYLGKDGFSHRNSSTAGIYFDLEVQGRHYRGNEHWKSIIHPAYYIPVGEKPNYRLAESNIGFRGEQAISFWENEFNDSGWANAAIVNRELSGWNAFVDRPIPQWKDYGLKSYVRTEWKNDTLLMAHLPYNAQITPYIKLRAKSGKVIDIRTDNYRGGSATNVFSEYITRGGEQSYESLGWMNGHIVCYRIPKGVEVLEVKYRETGYDTELSGTFSCNDEFYNRLWKKSQRTLYITMRDTYMDCPDRERAQWWGDVVNELGEAFYALDANAHLLTRKAILELMNWQRADSTIYAPIPAGNWNQELPMQMLASVGYYGFWTYYQGTGDKRTIAEVYPKVKKYLHVWKLDKEGLVIPRKGGWTWGDWGDNKDLALLYNLWYSLALKGFGEMAQLLDMREDKVWADTINSRLKETFHRKFWNGTFYVSPQYKGEPDDRAQALAVVSGIVPAELYATIRPFFKQQYHASPYMEKYVLEALCQMGYVDDALQRMKLRYKEMVNSELTTLWEGWGIGKEGFGGGSYNHAWSGGGLTILSQYIAGVSLTKTAFKEFQVKPNLGCLHRLVSETPTQWGTISLNISKAGEQMSVRLRVPDKTMAVIHLPDGYSTCLVAKKVRKMNDNKLTLKSGTWDILFIKK